MPWFLFYLGICSLNLSGECVKFVLVQTFRTFRLGKCTCGEYCPKCASREPLNLPQDATCKCSEPGDDHIESFHRQQNLLDLKN